MRGPGNAALITGCTSGIGCALAAEFVNRKNTVIVTGRDAGRLQAVCPALPGVHGYLCDQGDPSAIAHLHAKVASEFPGLNIQINNARIGLKRNLTDGSANADHLALELCANLIGPVQLVAPFLPQLRRQSKQAAIRIELKQLIALGVLGERVFSALGELTFLALVMAPLSV